MRPKNRTKKNSVIVDAWLTRYLRKSDWWIRRLDAPTIAAELEKRQPGLRLGRHHAAYYRNILVWLTTSRYYAALMSLVDHRCYCTFKDLLIVNSTCLVASYGMTQRDIKSVGTSSVRLYFPLIFPIASANKICTVIPASSGGGTRVCNQISRPKFPAPPTSSLILLIKIIAFSTAP